MSDEQKVYFCTCFGKSGLKPPLTGETPFQSPRRLSVRTTLKSSVTIPARPDLKGRQDRNCRADLLVLSRRETPFHPPFTRVSVHYPSTPLYKHNSCFRKTLSITALNAKPQQDRQKPVEQPHTPQAHPHSLTHPQPAAAFAGGFSAGLGVGRGVWSKCH